MWVSVHRLRFSLPAARHQGGIYCSVTTQASPAEKRLGCALRRGSNYHREAPLRAARWSFARQRAVREGAHQM